MKINTNYSYKKIGDIQKKNVEKSKSAKTEKNAEVKQDAVLDSKLLNHVETVSEREVFRQDKVEAIKQQLKDGTYNINFDELATKLID